MHCPIPHLRTKPTLVLLTLAFVSILAEISAQAGLRSFDTSTSLIFRGDIKSGGPPKDGIPTLTSPQFVPPEKATYLKSNDLVVGLALNGDIRAYPLRILIWHENANDRVGGVPIAVTYCPLCQSALVFDRRIGGQVREFGVSGLLYNSNVLLYDRQPDPRRESLWSQAEMRAVTGLAAKDGLLLSLLPSSLMSWSEWLARYPKTKVLSEDTGFDRSYRGGAYESYFNSDTLMFAVKQKTQRPRHFKKKELLAVVYADDTAKAYAVSDVASAAAQDGTLTDKVGNRRVRLKLDRTGQSVYVEPADGGGPLPVAYMFWFALSSMQPDVELFEP